MKRGKTDTIGNILGAVLQKSPLERGLAELHAVNAVHQLLGNLGRQYIRKVALKDGVLFVHLTSAALRQELYLSRTAFIHKINTMIGKEVVRELRLL